MKPSVGRIVHFIGDIERHPNGIWRFTPVCRAAIITEVIPLDGMDLAQADIEHWDEESRCELGLCVLNPEFHNFNRNVHYDPNHGHNTWHWPERVE